MTTPLSPDHRADALAELRAELTDFSWDGLLQLRDDLAGHAVLRGSWSGCVISYKCGAPGSCRRDRLGRARNAFTVLWDNGWLSDEDVRGAVCTEMILRQTAAVRQTAATDATGSAAPARS